MTPAADSIHGVRLLLLRQGGWAQPALRCDKGRVLLHASRRPVRRQLVNVVNVGEAAKPEGIKG